VFPVTIEGPPIARQAPTERTFHGDTVVDEFAWLQAKDDPATIALLESENTWTEQATAHLAGLRETVFQEIKGRTQETDLSVPSRKGGFWYYTRTEEGKQYGIHCRVPVGPGETSPPMGPEKPGEQVLLDGNELAEGKDFFALGTFDVSPDGKWLAYSTDFDGDERFTLRVKNLVTGEVLADEVTDVFYGSAWSADGGTLFYITVDEAWRPNRVWRHTVGTTENTLIFEEPDERFWVGVDLTRSEKFIVIDTQSKITSEVRVIPATTRRPSPP
jgi:oligopeptidase B